MLQGLARKLVQRVIAREIGSPEQAERELDLLLLEEIANNGGEDELGARVQALGRWNFVKGFQVGLTTMFIAYTVIIAAVLLVNFGVKALF